MQRVSKKNQRLLIEKKIDDLSRGKSYLLGLAFDKRDAGDRVGYKHYTGKAVRIQLEINKLRERLR